MLRRWSLAVLLIPIWAVAAVASEDRPVACDTLLAARRTESAAPGRDGNPDPECRRVARDSLGAVERRAMIGGAPYECLTVTGSAGCLWVVP